MPQLKKLNNLTLLDLGSNELTDIAAIKGLNNLTSLDLRNNELTDIAAIKGLNNLTSLDLRNNPLETLPRWIADSHLEFKWKEAEWDKGFIYFYNNPLKNPPVEIVKQGKGAVRDYFKSLKGETLRLNEAKALLVGEGMAGKTSLLKSLKGLEFDKDESQTHGVNVETLAGTDIPGFELVKGADDCRIHFWDFGGQEIMHASHQFFMSRRSLYILMLDSRTDSKKQYWLKHIEKHGGDSPVIVALNKVDDNPGYNVEQNKINSEFPNIKNRFHRISCRTKDGLPGLVKTISQAITETLLFGTEISKEWMDIKDALAKETAAKRYISRERFVEICNDNSVKDESSQQTLLQFLNDLGVILYFKQLKLSNIYVLDPHWVTMGVYKIINSAKIINGILKEDELGDILNKEKVKKDEYVPAKKKKITYKKEEQRYLLDIMKEFELCYEYGHGKAAYIVPDLLPKELEN